MDKNNDPVGVFGLATKVPNAEPTALGQLLEIARENGAKAQPMQQVARQVGGRPGVEEMFLQMQPQEGEQTSNITIVGIEQTQTIQYFDFNGQGSGFAANNSIPLIAQRPTILRVYIDCTTSPQFPIPGRITGKLNPYQLPYSPPPIPDLWPLNGPIPAKPSSTINRGNPDHTLNFEIPVQYCTGLMVFTVHVFDADHPNQANYAAQPLSVLVSFQNVPPLSVHGVLIHYTGPDYFNHPVDAQTTGLDLLESLDYVYRTYPISSFNYDGCEVLPWTAKLAVTQNFYDLFSKLGSMRALSGTNDLYIGLIPPEAGCGGICGLGGGGSALFFAHNGPEASHEMGHALGRPHTPCAVTAPGEDPHYPVYNSYPRGSIGEYGFDTKTRTLLDPNQTYDFMSYCQPVWVSPWTYLKLKEALTPISQPLLATAGSVKNSSIWEAEMAEFYHFSCRIYRDMQYGAVELQSAFHLNRRPPQVFGTPSNVTLELLTEAGDLIDVVRCMEHDLHVDAPMPFTDYIATFPYYPEMRSMRVVRDGNVLKVVEREQEAPHLEIVGMERTESHLGNLLRIRWQSEAPEGATPGNKYGVRYSHDGKHWRALAADLTETEHMVNLDLVPGGEHCHLQIVASAGLRTTVVETESFSVPLKPRKAYISSPQTGGEFEIGTPITLTGTGFSPDFGLTSPDEVTWYSRSIGAIGKGYQLTTTILPIGYHRITMYLPDGLGGEASASTEIRIASPKPAPYN